MPQIKHQATSRSNPSDPENSSKSWNSAQMCLVLVTSQVPDRKVGLASLVPKPLEPNRKTNHPTRLPGNGSAPNGGVYEKETSRVQLTCQFLPYVAGYFECAWGLMAPQSCLASQRPCLGCQSKVSMHCQTSGNAFDSEQLRTTFPTTSRCSSTVT